LLFTRFVSGSNECSEFPPLISNCPNAFAYILTALDAVGSFISPAFGPSRSEKVAADKSDVYVPTVVLMLRNAPPPKAIVDRVTHMVPPAPSADKTLNAGIFTLLLTPRTYKSPIVSESKLAVCWNEAILSYSKILSARYLFASLMKKLYAINVV
jgi:hypothetical protein